MRICQSCNAICASSETKCSRCGAPLSEEQDIELTNRHDEEGVDDESVQLKMLKEMQKQTAKISSIEKMVKIVFVIWIISMTMYIIISFFS